MEKLNKNEKEYVRNDDLMAAAISFKETSRLWESLYNSDDEESYINTTDISDDHFNKFINIANCICVEIGDIEHVTLKGRRLYIRVRSYPTDAPKLFEHLFNTEELALEEYKRVLKYLPMAKPLKFHPKELCGNSNSNIIIDEWLSTISNDVKDTSKEESLVAGDIVELVFENTNVNDDSFGAIRLTSTGIEIANTQNGLGEWEYKTLNDIINLQIENHKKSIMSRIHHHSNDAKKLLEKFNNQNSQVTLYEYRTIEQYIKFLDELTFENTTLKTISEYMINNNISEIFRKHNK